MNNVMLTLSYFQILVLYLLIMVYDCFTQETVSQFHCCGNWKCSRFHRISHWSGVQSSYRSNMEMSGNMSDYVCSFTNISGYVTVHIFVRFCNHLDLLTTYVIGTASEQPKPPYSYRGEPFALRPNSRVCNKQRTKPN